MRRKSFTAALAVPAVCVAIVAAGAWSAAAQPTSTNPASAQTEIHTAARVPASSDDGDGDSHGEMDMSGGEIDMSVAEMAELGHDPEGADHGESTSHEESDGTTHEDSSSADHEEEATHGDGAGSTAPRPLAAVLTVFLLVNAGVLTAAAVLRRRDRAKPRHRPRSTTSASASPNPA